MTIGEGSVFGFKLFVCPGGVPVAVGGTLAHVLPTMLLSPLLSRRGGKKVGFMGISRMRQSDPAPIGELLAVGRIESVIDRSHPLSAVPDAIRYLAEGHAGGKVVITIGDDGIRSGG